MRTGAVDLPKDLLHRVGMFAFIDAIPRVVADPHHVAFEVDVYRRWRCPEPVAILRFQLIAEVERLIAWWKRDGALGGVAA